MKACMAVAQPEQKANLKQMFGSAKQTFQTDRANMRSARQALDEAILSGSKDVTAQEEAVAKAGQQLLHDRDALTAQFCGQLSAQQLSAAKSLYSNLKQLRQQSHEKARSYFKAAKGAASQTPTTQSSD